MDFTIINLFGAFMEYFALYAFLWIFFEPDSSRQGWRRACHVLMPVLFFLFASYISNSSLRPALFVVCCWFIALGFRGNFWSRMFLVTIFQVSLILLEFLISYLVSPIADYALWSNYLATNIVVKISTLVILILLFLFSKRRRLYLHNYNTKHVLILLSFSATSFFLMMLINYLTFPLNDHKWFMVQCVAVLFCMVSNIGLYYLFYQLSVGEEAKIRLKLIDFHLSRQKE